MEQKNVDLSSFDADFSDAPAVAGDVPDGKYIVKVDKMLLTRARTSGHPMLKWTLKIIEGPCRGLLLFRNNMLATKENLAWLKKDLLLCELKLEKLSDLNDRIEELLDLKLEVTKRSRESNSNVFFNKLLGRVTDADEPSAHETASDSDIPF
jgi:hypothetical protein